MKELKDYSGKYNTDLKFEDFSKDALIRLIKSYQLSFVGLMGMWNTVNRERMSAEDAFKLDADVYERMLSKFSLPLVTQALNIKGNDVVTMFKYCQFAPDGAREGLYECNYEIKNNNHALMTFTRCPSLFYFERKGNIKDINSLCGPGGVEERAFIEICKYFNPKMKCKGLKLPPRKSKDDICCQWEFKIED
jgi:predicted phosphohydrolase